MPIAKPRRGSLWCAAALAILCAQSSFALAVPTTQPGAPRSIPIPSTRAAATQPATTHPSTITLNFKDVPLDAVLDYFSQAAGFIIVKEAPVDGRVTLISKQPVSSAEAIIILNAALRENGFAAVQNGRELKIVPRDQAKRGSIPVHFGADPQDVASTDELITQVIPVRNVDAAQLKQDITPLVGAGADLTANEGANAIVMTDISSNIRRVVQIVAALDQQESTATDLRVIQLKYAIASTTAKLIETIFQAEGAAQGPRQNQPMVMGPQGPQPANPQAPGHGAGRTHGKIVAAADDRTNTLVLVGTTDVLKSAENLLKQLDSNQTPVSEIRAFPLRYGDAESASKLVQSIFKPESGSPFPFFGRFNGGDGGEAKINVNTAFDERTNTVVVTAPASAMKEIENVIKSLDVNSDAATKIKIWTLKFADAAAAAKLINSVFNPSPSQDTRQIIPIFIFGGGPTQPQHGQKVTTNSDDRTNTLIVTAPLETMKVIEGIVKELDDNPASEQTFFIYAVKNGQAQDIAFTLNSLFGVQGGGENRGRSTNGTTNTIGNLNNNNGNRNGGGVPNNANGNNNAPINRNNNNQPTAAGAVPSGVANAASSLTGQVFVVADTDTNSLVVATATKYQSRVKAIIAELDRPVAQVLIKVLIAEVTHDNSLDLGADFSVLNTRASGNGQTLVSTFGNALSQTSNGGLAVGILETNLTATLHLLAEQNKLDVLSRPYILASDNQIATITVGQEVPIITGSQTSELTGGITNSITYTQVGITLNVTPHINPEGLVILDVAPEVSQMTSSSVQIASGGTGVNAGTINAPIFDNRAADTRVGIRDGSTIVIGGMMQDQKSLTVSKVPLLGDIPWLGTLFSRTQVQKTKTELLIFLTPHVAFAPDRLKPMSEEEMKGLKLTPNAVQPGTFQEQMRGMARGGSDTRPTTVPAPTTQAHPPAEPPLPGTHH